MKKILFIIALFLGFNANSQSHVVIGDWEFIDAMFYFEVTDSYSNASMKDVKVELLDGKVCVATAYTNYRGAALFVIKGVGHLESNMTFRIQKENYSSWSQTLEDQWDVLQYMKRNQVGIIYKDKRGLKRLRKPSSYPWSIKELLRGNFEKFNGSTNGYGGTKYPGMMQFQVSLDYNRHPKNRKRYGNSGQVANQNNSSNQWIKSSRGSDVITFTKGDKEIEIVNWGSNGYSVTIGPIGNPDGSEPYLPGGKDCSTLNQALSVAKKYMDKN